MKAFTYDDILMVPSYNHWESRRAVDISMKCKMGKLSLALPLMTANMDTITESEMANFIGAKGGIGVLHRYMSIEDNVQIYRGMASREVQKDYHGGIAEWKTAEGVTTEVSYREDEDEIIADIIGGLRSGLTYGGADSIEELQRKLDYQEITPAGWAESLPHRTCD